VVSEVSKAGDIYHWPFFLTSSLILLHPEISGEKGDVVSKII